MKNKEKKIKKRLLLYLIVMVLAFCGGIFYFSAHSNQGNRDLVADLDSATLPEISFAYRGYSINHLIGYTREMDMASVRDTITPVNHGTLDLRMNAHDTKVQGIEVKIYTLDGEKEIFKQMFETPEKEMNIIVEDESLLKKERVMKLTVTFDKGRTAYYYTRVVSDHGTHLFECLDYAYNFHEDAIEKNEDSSIKRALETEAPVADNYSHVTINSDFEHVCYGTMAPTLVGSESWQIKELNTVTSSICVQYRIRSTGEGKSKDGNLYKAQEFFRVRYKTKKSTVLLNYDRRMSQVYELTKKSISGSGIFLGVGNSDLQYMSNSTDEIVAFVQAGELWCYNAQTDEMSQVFTFASAENKDKRNLTNQYEIKLLGMDKKGNLDFAVIGYMNRGLHEGEVGVDVFRYNVKNDSVEEKAFVSTTKSANFTQMEMGQLIYYTQDSLYILVDDTLYEYDTKRGKMFTVQEGLKENQYIMSKDGHLVAYVKTTENGNDITVRNLKSGSSRMIDCSKEETYVLLGFMQNDLVYGVANDQSVAKTSTGEMQKGIYKIEIQNSKGKVVKTYQEPDVYILEAVFDQNMITLKRATKEEDTFKDIEEEYITNNESEEDDKITVDSYYTNQAGYQIRLGFANGITPDKTTLHKPQYEIDGKSYTYAFDTDDNSNMYYVYGYGTLCGMYEKASDAIFAADQYSGVVVSSKQTYVWERGNRDLTYRIESEEPVVEEIRSRLAKGETPSDVMKDVRGKDLLELSGCTVEQLMYIINKGHPIVAMVGEEKCVLLVGYTESTVTCMNVKSGERKAVRLTEFEKMAKKGHFTFIG